MKQPDEMSEDEVKAVAAIGTSLEAMNKATEWGDAARADRDKAIGDLRLAGWTVGDCATIAELSKGQVHNICTALGISATRGAKRSAVRS